MHDFPSISWELASKLALIHNRIFNLLICSNQNTLKKINDFFNCKMTIPNVTFK